MSLLSDTYRASLFKDPPQRWTGLDRLTLQTQGWWHRKSSANGFSLQLADQIHQRSCEYQQLTLPRLQELLTQQQLLFKRGRIEPAQLTETFALLAEASFRILHLRPYPVQILAAYSLHQGYLAEMATGEGKSLVTCLAAILVGWSEKPCHVITANDYLATRDAEQFAPFFRFCNLSVGTTTAGMSSGERRQQYHQAVVYTTSKELLADYLRDQIALGSHRSQHQRLLKQYLRPAANVQLVLRGIDTAIIDEADSVLIDEATTPLIISQQQPNPELNDACRLAHQLAGSLEKDRDYRVDSEQGRVLLSKVGRDRVSEMADGLPVFFRDPARAQEMVLLALTAREFFHHGQQYLLEDGKVVIVDQFTGRKMEQRTWQRGLQQMIELQEGVEPSHPSESLAQLSFQVFFSLFQKLSGTTGTAWETRKELWEVYGLPVVKIPLNKPERRSELPATVYYTQTEKLAAIVAEANDCYRRDQPVLIGTRNISDSEQIVKLLQQAGIPHQLLNAAQDQQEAEIIANAGQLKQVTVATNMAGRGADIKLGRGVAELGGLHVIVSELHESKRIDRQLIGRAARQGEPGSFRIYRSAEDEIISRYANLNRLASLAIKGKVASAYLSSLLTLTAQKLIQRQATKQRRELARRDEWLTEMLP